MRPRQHIARFVALFVVGSGFAADVAGCNGDPTAPDGGDNGAMDSAVVAAPDLAPQYPAPFPTPPQEVSAGGPVLAAPRIVPVFFSNDDVQTKAKIKTFLTVIGGSDYWSTIGAEYGVGPATMAPAVELAETSTGTFDDATIQVWLAAKLNNGDPAFPQPDENTVYVLHYPAGVVVTQPSFMGTGTSCTDFGGYHGDVALNSVHNYAQVAYAVIPRCTDFNGLSGMDIITATESHELIEAATDPYPHLQPANNGVDGDHLYWSFVLGGGEVGDLCAQEAAAFMKFPGLPYTVQRIWSNVQELAGHDPCIPHLDNDVYFNAVPVLVETVSLQFGDMKGINIPVGSSGIVELDLFSEADTGGDWTIKAEDAGPYFGLPISLSLKLDTNKGKNGDKLHLTIKSVTASALGASAFIITSSLGAKQHMWVGLVGQ